MLLLWHELEAKATSTVALDIYAVVDRVASFLLKSSDEWCLRMVPITFVDE
jgi:hypothetical protein